MFKKEEQLLISLQRDIEDTESIEANTVAYLSTKIQEIRHSLREKNVSIENSRKERIENSNTAALSLKKPHSTSLAEQKKKEYYF
jgi:hypothetical protein